MDNYLKEKLLDWIDTHIESHISLNEETYGRYIGDTEEPFVIIQERVYRKELFFKYLSNPTEQTIRDFLNELVIELSGAGSVKRRAINKILNRFDG